MQELISIVIPVYNAEAFLPQCLDSILAQTYKNIEVICVDDSSNDNSLMILQRYAQNDSRIKVFSKSNEGVSRARNYGIEKTAGELLMFVDADDWIDLECCSLAYEEMKANKADVVMWAYISESENWSVTKAIYTSKTTFNETEVKSKIHRRFIGIIGEELAHPEKADSLCTIWGKLYKKELITKNDIRFIDLNDIGTYEDGMFNLQVFQNVSSAVYLPEALYHYRRTNSNSLTSKYRERLPMQWNHLFDLMQKHINENNLGIEYAEALNNRIALSILGLGLNITMSDYSVKQQCSLIKNIITTDRYKKASANLNMQYFPLHWKIFYGSAKHGVVIGVYILLSVIRKIIYG